MNAKPHTVVYVWDHREPPKGEAHLIVHPAREVLSQVEGNQVYSPLRAVSIDYTFALLATRTTTCTSVTWE